jgi:hypothetical protein
MNVQEALDTANWLVGYAFTDEMSPAEILRVRQMRDVIYYFHAAAGIPEIRLDAYERGFADCLLAEQSSPPGEDTEH